MWAIFAGHIAHHPSLPRLRYQNKGWRGERFTAPPPRNLRTNDPFPELFPDETMHWREMRNGKERSRGKTGRRTAAVQVKAGPLVDPVPQSS